MFVHYCTLDLNNALNIKLTRQEACAHFMVGLEVLSRSVEHDQTPLCNFCKMESHSFGFPHLHPKQNLSFSCMQTYGYSIHLSLLSIL